MRNRPFNCRRRSMFARRSEPSGISIMGTLGNWCFQHRRQGESTFYLDSFNAGLTKLMGCQSKKVFVGIGLTALSLAFSFATKVTVVHVIARAGLILHEGSSVRSPGGFTPLTFEISIVFVENIACQLLILVGNDLGRHRKQSTIRIYSRLSGGTKDKLRKKMFFKL